MQIMIVVVLRQLTMNLDLHQHQPNMVQTQDLLQLNKAQHLELDLHQPQLNMAQHQPTAQILNLLYHNMVQHHLQVLQSLQLNLAQHQITVQIQDMVLAQDLTTAQVQFHFIPLDQLAHLYMLEVVQHLVQYQFNSEVQFMAQDQHQHNIVKELIVPVMERAQLANMVALLHLVHRQYSARL